MTKLEEVRSLLEPFPQGASKTLLPRVEVARGEIPLHALTGVYPPMINLVVNGSKELLVEGQTHRYDPSHYFVLSLDLPATGFVHPAADNTPYLAVALLLDPEVVNDVVAHLPAAPVPQAPQRAYEVCPTTDDLLDAWVRLLRLLGNPTDATFLSDLYEREILYKVLQGPAGRLLRSFARPEGVLTRVRHSVEWLRRHYPQPFLVETLADQAAMSVSSFHRHFRRATGLSPIQYQKKFRLLAARRLLITSGRTVTEAALEVGYESLSQFSRDYARFFGLSPNQDKKIVTD